MVVIGLVVLVVVMGVGMKVVVATDGGCGIGRYKLNSTIITERMTTPLPVIPYPINPHYPITP